MHKHLQVVVPTLAWSSFFVHLILFSGLAQVRKYIYSEWRLFFAPRWFSIIIANPHWPIRRLCWKLCQCESNDSGIRIFSKLQAGFLAAISWVITGYQLSTWKAPVSPRFLSQYFRIKRDEFFRFKDVAAALFGEDDLNILSISLRQGWWLSFYGHDDLWHLEEYKGTTLPLTRRFQNKLQPRGFPIMPVLVVLRDGYLYS